MLDWTCLINGFHGAWRFLAPPVTLCPEVMLESTNTFWVPALKLPLAPSEALQEVKGV